MSLCGDDDSAKEVSDALRILLSEWLTVPVPFDSKIFESIDLGNPDGVGIRWGHEIRTSYDEARRSAQEVNLAENPIRMQLRTVIRELRSQGKVFKIFCHRKARTHFESVMSSQDDAPLQETTFLHSERDYRETEPFDVLIKVGPLRSRGWGVAPDALLTAPRFSTLVQVVWSGCSDEPGFGYDPVSPSIGTGGTPGNAAVSQHGTCSHRISWTSHVTRSGDDVSAFTGGTSDVDEFQVFRGLSPAQGRHPAMLVQINEEDGILYPPRSQVLSFDPGANAGDSIRLRLPGETLTEGMFVILPDLLDEVDLGGLQAEEGRYSQIWQNRLREEFADDPDGLLQRLHEGGITLLTLRSCIEHWYRPPSTVIHAPQRARDFEILIKVLGVDFGGSPFPRGLRAPGWQYAWTEIRRSRGEAIQTGKLGQEIVDERLMDLLNGLFSEIQSEAATRGKFQLSMPASQPIHGIFRFYKVYSVEEGFLAPDTTLRIIWELNIIEQWRV